jgi:hypothetical protein
MEISILGSKKTSDIVEFLLDSQPPWGIIRTTAYYFLLPYYNNCDINLVISAILQVLLSSSRRRRPEREGTAALPHRVHQVQKGSRTK